MTDIKNITHAESLIEQTKDEAIAECEASIELLQDRIKNMGTEWTRISGELEAAQARIEELKVALKCREGVIAYHERQEAAALAARHASGAVVYVPYADRLPAAEQAEAMKDAVRYRWLRDNTGEISTSAFENVSFYGDIANAADARGLDALVDAAIASAEGGV